MLFCAWARFSESRPCMRLLAKESRPLPRRLTDVTASMVKSLNRLPIVDWRSARAPYIMAGGLTQMPGRRLKV